MRVLKRTSWSETGPVENHKDDSDDLFRLQYNHSMKSQGELITTKVIGQSTAESVSKCGVTFRYLKKAH